MKEWINQEKIITMGNKFDIPMNDILGLPHIDLCGNRLIVENHRGVIQYSDFDITISGGKHLISVSGTNLSIISMTRGELVIDGQIQKIEFSM